MGRPNGTGRPSLLQDPACASRVEALLSAVEAGLSAAGACRASAIAQATLYDWLERAEEDDAPAYLVEFSERYARARGERERARIQVIDAAGQKDWRAAAWLLERQEPSDYGARQYVEQETTHVVKALEITGAPLPEQEPAVSGLLLASGPVLPCESGENLPSALACL